MPNKFDPSFNPSPFDDRNKDDLNEMLRECEAKDNEAKKVLETFFDILTGKTEQLEIQNGQVTFKKRENWPLQFFAARQDHRAIFQALLTRANKDLILGFAYDWLKEHGLVRVEVLREEFVTKFWNDNFEHIII